MMKCWICEKNDADSGEHFIMKYALDKIIGKPAKDESRYITYIGGKKNIPVKSFRNDRFKFKKSICVRCNDTLTQPYDNAFRKFIDWIWDSKSLIIFRNKIVFNKFDNNELANLALYFAKIFGCLIVETKAHIKEADYQLLRQSLLQGEPFIDCIFLTAHRDLAKQTAKKSSVFAQTPVVTSEFTTWTLDLDWITFVISYPIAPPVEKYGSYWQLNHAVYQLKLGKLH